MSLQVLERPKPPEPDEALLDDVQAYIERFIDLPTPSHGRVLAVWLVHTYSCDVFYVTPYLYISSKGPEAGKTKLMDVLASLALNPDWATDAPTHVIAQEIEASRPTLFVDEADTTFRPGSPNTGLKRVFNIGYEKGPGSVIKRQRGNEPKRWSVYCAKCLAGIRNNHLPDSLLTRCIPIEMVKRSREVERFNKFHMARDRERIELADRIATFAETFATEMALARPEPMKALGDRHNEIVEPLLAIAGVLGREQEDRKSVV